MQYWYSEVMDGYDDGYNVIMMKVMVQVVMIVMVAEKGWCSCSIGDSDGFSMVTVMLMVDLREQIGVILIGRLE